MKWSNTLKKWLINCLSVFNHFMGLMLKGLKLFTITDHLEMYLFENIDISLF